MPSIVQRFRSRWAPLVAGSDATTKPAWATRCLNCDAPLSSAYCPDCGQRAVPPHPSMNELAGDAFAELSGWDGKFVETFRLLLRKPGELTRQFIEGKRVRYIAPVRLYLTLSLVYFVLVASAPVLAPIEYGVSAGPLNIGVKVDPPTNTTPAQRAGIAALSAQAGMLTEQDRRDAEAEVAKAPRLMRPILERAIKDPVGFKRNLFENMPRVMFVLVPLLGLVVGLFYRGRNYPEHLYFALHTASFVFLIMAVVELSKFTHVFLLSAVLGIIAQLAIPVYGFLALRRVYGGTIGATVAKELGIVVLYGVAYAAAIMCAIYYAAVAA